MNMRRIFIILLQALLFIGYDIGSGAATKEIYDIKMISVRETHERQMAKMLLLIPIDMLGYIRITKL